MMTPEDMADAFTRWAESEGILARVTREQVADLAKAFAAGAAIAVGDLAKPRGTGAAIIGSFNIDGPHSPDQTRRVAGLLAECLRYLNHATRPGQGGLEYPADVYHLVGDLKITADRLPQLLSQCADFLRGQAALGQLGDTGHPDGSLWARVVANDLESVATIDAAAIARRFARSHADLSSLYVKDGEQ